MDSVKTEVVVYRKELDGSFSPGYELKTSLDRYRDALIELVISDRLNLPDLTTLRGGYFNAKKAHDEFKVRENFLIVKVRELNQRIESLNKRVKELGALLGKHRQSIQFVKKAISQDAIMDTTP